MISFKLCLESNTTNTLTDMVIGVCVSEGVYVFVNGEHLCNHIENIISGQIQQLKCEALD